MKVDTQNIPSKLHDDYIGSLRPSTQWWTNLFGTFKFGTRKFGIGPDKYIVRARQPFRIPHMQGLGPNTPSGAQILVRQAFKKCCDCFNEQPDEGGAVPPEPGPRNRSWWFDRAAPSGLWYYDYFIQQSWYPFYIDEPPIWCILRNLANTFIGMGYSWDEDVNYSETWHMEIGKIDKTPPAEDSLSYGLIKATVTLKKDVDLYLLTYIHATIVDVYAVDPASYDNNTVTWNTQPPRGKFLKRLTMTAGYTWVKFPLPKEGAIMIVPISYADGSPPDFMGPIAGAVGMKNIPISQRPFYIP